MAEIKYYTYVDILRLDLGKQTFDTDSLKHLVAKVLTQVPADIVDKVYEDCFFFTIDERKKGAFLSKNIIQDRNIIFLTHELYGPLSELKDDIILHEIAHYYLDHKSWDERFKSEKRDPEDLISTTKNQEIDAHKLKDKWLADYSKNHERGALWQQ
jgi:hypothetical protein